MFVNYAAAFDYFVNELKEANYQSTTILNSDESTAKPTLLIKISPKMGIRNIMKLNFILISLVMLCGCLAQSQRNHHIEQGNEGVYLFSSFRGNGNDGLHLSYSQDGLTWHVINNDQSLLTPKVGGKLMRDPCLILGPDNRFHMVWTSSWEDGGIGIAHSDDLINWSEQQFIPVMKDFPTAKNAWAPEIIWDEKKQQPSPSSSSDQLIAAGGQSKKSNSSLLIAGLAVVVVALVAAVFLI